MYERISESNIRENKIRALKDKIIKEIQILDEETKVAIKELGNLTDTDLWKYYIERAFFLIQLLDFINSDSAFQSIIAEYRSVDKVVYNLSIESIDIFLQENFNFTRELLLLIKNDNGFGHIDNYLNDRCFELQIINIFERTLWRNNNEN